MTTTDDYRKLLNLPDRQKFGYLPFEKEKESRERVWKNVEKALDQFEQDFIRNKEELKVVLEPTTSTLL